MAEVVGRVFGFYAIYRAWVGRPIPGCRRPKRLALVAFEWPPRGTQAVTAQYISANAIPANLATSAVTWRLTDIAGNRINTSG